MVQKERSGEDPERDERLEECRDADFSTEEPDEARGLGAESGGQAGDIEGLSRAHLADSESEE
jgi:hypothetical protein